MGPIGLSLLACLALTGAASPRIRQRFDDGWRFLLESGTELPGTPVRDWTWKVGADDAWQKATLPTDLLSGEWKAATIGQDLFRGRRGTAWVKATILIKPDPNLTLHFEAVDDDALVFVDGNLAGRHEGWSDPFEVSLGSLSAGKHEIVVLVRNGDGVGGLGGPVWVASPKLELSPKEARADHDDRAWRTVHVPHDYVVEGTFDKSSDTSHGSLPTPTAWYRKTFELPANWRDKDVWIEFDGVYRNAVVYFNGHRLGAHPSGYIGFREALNAYGNFGGKNVIAVHVDPRRGEGWWYEGAGIYRHVWLNAAAKSHIDADSLFVRAELPEPVNGDAPTATVLTDFSVSVAKTIRAKTTLRLIDPSGRTVAESTIDGTMKPGMHPFAPHIAIAQPKLWSLESPNLYTAEVSISVDGVEIDRVSKRFGIRTIRFDPDRGFFLNGKAVKMKGTCNHQDHAGVGIALPDGLIEWRIRKLMEMGSNAYRCSHNPPASELLDACDRLGMLVMDETRHLGDTTLAKSPRGTKADDLSELRAMLLRDRNHPSIVMWSLFNEEPLQGSKEGLEIFNAMKALTHKLDGTRPTTGAMNWGWAGEGITNGTELQGVNYSIDQYAKLHREYPKLPIFGSETASTVGTRGEYRNDAAKGYVSAYDKNKPDWGATAEAGWKPIGENEWNFGGFVWTGFDYKGEPTPYGWPCINSHFGIMDICGFPKDNFFYYQAWWGSKPVVHILPHWNWAGREGEPIEVWVQSNADEVDLLLNGNSLGRQRMPRFGHLEWSVQFAPGSLVAAGYRDGKEIARDEVVTTGPATQIRLKPEGRAILADGEDIVVIQVEILDAKGHVVPDAANRLEFSAMGPAVIAGVGNGDPSSHEPDKASHRSAFHGLAMALVGQTYGKGKTTFTVTSPGLNSASIVLNSK